jgi:YidC/Oxa1 family membrane protein insertase
MDNQRLLLWAALGFLLLQIWTSWQIDYGPRPQPAPVADATQPSVNTGVIDQSETPAANNDLPTPATTEASPSTTAQTSALPTDNESVAEAGTQIMVETDTLRVSIGTKGGDINRVELLQYPTSIQTPEDPFELMSNQEGNFFIAQSGLQSTSADVPTHHSVFKAEQTEYTLADGSDQIRVPLTWVSESGVEVTKTYTFSRDRYFVEVDYTINNNSGAEFAVNQYRQLRRKPVTDDETQSFIYTFIGGVYSTAEDRYSKISFDDFDDAANTLTTVGGWTAIIEHYFLGAWIPQPEENNTFYTKALSSPQRYIIGMQSEALRIADGSSGELSTGLFVGPKIQDRMAKVAPHLDLTVDYGFLSVIAKPIFWLLQKIHALVGNWGWAIVGVTMCIKLIFYKLSEASYRSMARMRKLQPQLASLKERYGDDRAKMGQATMDLYKKEKVNPLGGCLPILVQIPVFISLYWVLLESVELRQAPWILWIEDLSLMDKFYVLPVIMGVTMFIQQKLNPAPVDPIQAKVFMFMPLIFTVFFAFFPAGLVLYWVVNNTLSIAQQYYITRHVLAEK